MRHTHRLVPVIAAAAVLSAIPGCGHREEFRQAAKDAFRGNATGLSTSSSTTGGGGVPGVPDEILDLKINGHDMVPGYWEPADPQVDQVFNAMSLEQRIAQMQGTQKPVPVHYLDIERSPDVPDVGGLEIRGYRYRDAGKGVNLDAGQDNRARDNDNEGNYATAFPAPSVRAASWDMDLEWRVGYAMGDETAASKNNMLLAPCMNIIRHPYWGRTQETYGEDSFHIGRMASAFTAGLQQTVVACAKHYAANNVEKNRINQDAVMNEQTLREIYGRHFEMVVRDGGVGCIMAAYNKNNGTKSTQNAHLLTDVLRAPYDEGGMGYRGLVISDWWAMPGWQGPIDTGVAVAQAAEAARAGLDIEVPWTLHYGLLATAISQGELDQGYVNAAARRVLEQKFRFSTALASDPWGRGERKTRLEGASIVDNEEHLDLAEEAAIKSAVLLKNGMEDERVLPLAEPESIAVIGAELRFQLSESNPTTSVDGFLRFATQVSVGDRGSSRVNADPDKSVGPFDGIDAVSGEHGVSTVTTGTTAADAEDADVVVVVVGLTPDDEGEEYPIAAGGDRTTLDLPGGEQPDGTELEGGQNQLVSDVLDLDKPTIIVVESGSIVSLPWLDHENQKQATVWMGYSGQRGGLALARLLFGEFNFSGKMPLAWPLDEDLPSFKNQTGENSTEMGYFFGYRLYDHLAEEGTPADLVFPFGWGMSYTTFTYSGLQVQGEDATEDSVFDMTEDSIFDVTVDITNEGEVDGEEIAMLFVVGPEPPPGTVGERNVKELKSFAKVAVNAGETETARLPIRVQDLRHWECTAGEDACAVTGEEAAREGHWVIDPGQYTLMVGPNADALELQAVINVQ